MQYEEILEVKITLGEIDLKDIEGVIDGDLKELDLGLMTAEDGSDVRIIIVKEVD